MASTQALTPNRCTRLDGLLPIDVAARLRHLPGLVFFDTAGNLPGSAHQPVSVIAARPQHIHRGSIHHRADRARLRSALSAMPVVAGDHGFPLSGLAGWVSYEGDFVFGEFPEMLVHDHQHQQWWECGELSAQLAAPQDLSATISAFQPACPANHFKDAVSRIQEWISAGDIYQANISQSFEAKIQGGSLFGLYQALRDSSPAPMAAWLALDGMEILSSSP